MLSVFLTILYHCTFIRDAVAPRQQCARKEEKRLQKVFGYKSSTSFPGVGDMTPVSNNVLVVESERTASSTTQRHSRLGVVVPGDIATGETDNADTSHRHTCGCCLQGRKAFLTLYME